jgi:hypothetical protein
LDAEADREADHRHQRGDEDIAGEVRRCPAARTAERAMVKSMNFSAA